MIPTGPEIPKIQTTTGNFIFSFRALETALGSSRIFYE